MTTAMSVSATFSVTLPLRTVSEPNTRGHWSARAKRAREQRTLTCWSLRAELVGAGLLQWVESRGGHRVYRVAEPVEVTLTRIAPRALDDDNLRGACKGVRDGAADALGVDDRDPLVTWRYAQRRGRPREYAVGIRVAREQGVTLAELLEAGVERVEGGG